MRAYLIDPQFQEVTEVFYGGDIREIYEMIQATCFDLVRINSKRDAIYVDDEGLVTPGAKFTFMWMGYPNVLVGRGLILGCDEQGETTDPHIDLETAQRSVVWTGQMEIA